MPQGAGYGGDKRAGGNPNGGGKASGGQGSFGDRGTGYGGIGYKGPGAGTGFKSGSKAIQGTRNTLHNVPTRPGTFSNIATALGLGLGFGPSTAAGLIGGQMMGYDPYSGPTGTGHMIEHDPPNNGGFYASQQQGQPGISKPMAVPSVPSAAAPQQSPSSAINPFFRYQGIPGGLPYGVNIFGPMR